MIYLHLNDSKSLPNAKLKLKLWPALSFRQSCVLFLARFFSISGRSSRAEYWWVSAIELILWLGTILFLDWLWEFAGFNELVKQEHQRWLELEKLKLQILQFSTVALPLLSLTLTIRRLHDRGHSGWLVLLYLLPLGWLILTIIAALPGENQINRYGFPPQWDLKSHYAYYCHWH